MGKEDIDGRNNNSNIATSQVERGKKKIQVDFFLNEIKWSLWITTLM